MLLATLMVVGMSGCARPHEFNFLNEPTYGDTGNCPQHRANLAPGPPGGDDRFAADAARCSYKDALGGYVVELGGQVRTDLGPANPGLAAEGVVVTLHRLGEGGSLATATGPKVAAATTDAQGNWHISALVKKPGDHILVARATEEGAALAFTRVRIERPDQPGLVGLVIVLPRDAAMSPP